MPGAAASLSAAELATFGRDGFVFPFRACTPAATVRNRSAFDSLEAAHGKSNHFGVDEVPLHLAEPWAWELATSPAVLAALRQLLPGGDILCIASHLFCKYGSAEEAGESTAGAGAFVGWHQDLRFWGLQPSHVVTAFPGRC